MLITIIFSCFSSVFCTFKGKGHDLGPYSLHFCLKICSIQTRFFVNSSTNSKTLALTLYQMTKFWTSPKLKASADNKLNVGEKLKYVLVRVENIVGNEENAGFQHFLLFTGMFSEGFFLKVVKSWDCIANS